MNEQCFGCFLVENSINYLQTWNFNYYFWISFTITQMSFKESGSVYYWWMIDFTHNNVFLFVFQNLWTLKIFITYLWLRKFYSQFIICQFHTMILKSGYNHCTNDLFCILPEFQFNIFFNFDIWNKLLMRMERQVFNNFWEVLVCGYSRYINS